MGEAAKQKIAKKRLVVLLSAAAVTLLSVEVLSCELHAHRAITLEIERGISEAVAIRPASNVRAVLFAGNSMVYEDLSQRELQSALGASYRVFTAGIPGSTYFDWSYGLPSLAAKGSKPDVVIFSISPSQFLREAAVSPTAVARLWRTREVLAYVWHEKASLTTLSELILERYSTFFSLRDTIRIYTRKFVPGYKPMVDGWGIPKDVRAAQPDPTRDAGSSERLLEERLLRLVRDCRPPIRFVLLITPTNQPIDDALKPELRVAAAKLGVPVLEPVREKAWPASKFKADRYHLTTAAAKEFSQMVGLSLQQAMEVPSTTDLARSRTR